MRVDNCHVRQDYDGADGAHVQDDPALKVAAHEGQESQDKSASLATEELAPLKN